MNQVLRAYKYRIYPTKKQEIYLGQVFGSVRFVWNQLVAAFNSYSKTGPNPKVLNYSAVIPPFSQEKLIIISYKDNNHKNDLSFLETKIQNLILKYSTEIK
jgi:cadmium resistance protein CadD (predicted permease)